MAVTPLYLAELNGLAVLHYDADYDRVAEATGGKSTQVLRHDAGLSGQETA